MVILSDINMWLYLKDKFNLSDDAWHKIAMKAKDLYDCMGSRKGWPSLKGGYSP